MRRVQRVNHEMVAEVAVQHDAEHTLGDVVGSPNEVAGVINAQAVNLQQKRAGKRKEPSVIKKMAVVGSVA